MTLGLDPQATALLLIDPQNWTLGMPIQPHPRHELVQRAAALIEALRSAGGTVILTRAAFSGGYADMLRTPVDVELRVPEGGIPAASLAFDDEIETAGYDVAITKRQWSAFYGTELDLQLRRRNIATVLIGGVMTNFGVESTARDAWQHNYSTIVVEDLCSSLADDMHRFSVEKILPRVARVRSLNNVLTNLPIA
ncbi:isochorismatase family protein [Microvirga lotononidis]|uniref:Nicotinamidase-like amidase n=1 Tax=Microvirga lotononidis TaxID=864069 RepID=I4YRI2_9HYPH|nr:isochorismatase family protein [Microvirga lotononidis]EIM26574.1 nicotinamidase-like amidase [Microvirga lotononidis]WQO31253.1 isochorismatase family protein [Microvirga lotononidis]